MMSYSLANIACMTSSTDKQAEYVRLINKNDDCDTTDGAGGKNALPYVDAYSILSKLGSVFSPLVIFSTGS